VPYKISGTKTETARVFVIDESDYSIENNTLISGSGYYEVTDVTSGTKIVLARSEEGELLSYGAVVSKYVAPIYPDGGDRGVFFGGQTSGQPVMNTIDYVTISTTGNASSFGYNLAVAKRGVATCSNSGYDRGIIWSGYSSAGTRNVIEYVTITSPSNVTDFGDLTTARTTAQGLSNGPKNRGVLAGGNHTNMEYITINSTSNASAFGNTTKDFNFTPGAFSNNINERGVWGGGDDGGYLTEIEYITINTTGNTSDFGDLSLGRRSLAGSSNGTNERGVFGGGYNLTDRIDYITINSTGNATDFGNLTLARRKLGGTSNGTDERAIWGGGASSVGYENDIDYVTINSTGNASSFGSLNTRMDLSATSNA